VEKVRSTLRYECHAKVSAFLQFHWLVGCFGANEKQEFVPWKINVLVSGFLQKFPVSCLWHGKSMFFRRLEPGMEP